MNIYLRELLTAALVGLLTGLSLSGGKLWLGVLALLLALLAASWFLRLRSAGRRGLYYLVPILIAEGGIVLAAWTLPGGATGLVTGFLTFLVLYLLLRALISRRFEPRADVPLHQNAYLASVWVGSFLALYGLFELALTHRISFFIPALGSGLVVFLLAQALAFFFLIPPWEFRRDSFAAAVVVTEGVAVMSIWATTPFFAAAISMVLLYLFWGLDYHARKGLLTRRLIYEYGLISVGLATFLLVVNRWIAAS